MALLLENPAKSALCSSSQRQEHELQPWLGHGCVCSVKHSWFLQWQRPGPKDTAFYRTSSAGPAGHGHRFEPY